MKKIIWYEAEPKNYLSTRLDIMENWLNDNRKNLNKYICPNCKNILSRINNKTYTCVNEDCANCKLHFKV